MQAVRRDLVRICAEIRDEVESAQEPAWAAGAAPTPNAGGAEPARHIAGVIHVSCAARGGPHFGGPSAELQIVRHMLSGGGPEVPLVGFFAGGEIARQHVYGCTGVLTVFTGHG
jgi:small ligand-binding sensory domain FIST